MQLSACRYPIQVVYLDRALKHRSLKTSATTRSLYEKNNQQTPAKPKKKLSVMKKLFPSLTIAAALVASGTSQAETAYSKPSGYVSIGSASEALALPPSSDAALSVPLANPAAFVGVSSATVPATETVLTLDVSPSWVPSAQWALSPHLLIVTEGQEEGLIALIVDNGVDSLTVSPVVGALSNIGGSVQFRIEPAHTLLKLFPLSSVPNGTQVILLSEAATATNLGAATIYTKGPSSWITTFGGSGVADQVVLYPGEGFIVRTPASAGIETIVFTGEVPTWNHRTVIRKASGSKAADNLLSYYSPVAIGVNDIGIPAVAGDQIILYDTSAAGRNKGASQILTRGPNNWFGTFGPATGIQDDFPLGGAKAFTYRRSAAAPDEDNDWVNSQQYRDDL